jgi:hypothetical protein
MHNGVAFLEALLRLVADGGFVLAIFGVVVAASVLAFGFGAKAEVVAAVLVLGVMTAISESKLRTRT